MRYCKGAKISLSVWLLAWLLGLGKASLHMQWSIFFILLFSFLVFTAFGKSGRLVVKLCAFHCKQSVSHSDLCSECSLPFNLFYLILGVFLLILIVNFKTKTYGYHSYSVYAPYLWNSLPENIRSIHSLSAFKSQLKTHMFKLAFNLY